MSQSSTRQLHRNRGFRAFLSRHDKILTLVSAFIVFATFIVRDEMKEDMKGKIDSIESLESSFQTRNDMNALSEQLNLLATIGTDTLQALHVEPAERDQIAILGLRMRVFAIQTYTVSLLTQLLGQKASADESGN